MERGREDMIVGMTAMDDKSNVRCHESYEDMRPFARATIRFIDVLVRCSLIPFSRIGGQTSYSDLHHSHFPWKDGEIGLYSKGCFDLEGQEYSLPAPIHFPCRSRDRDVPKPTPDALCSAMG